MGFSLFWFVVWFFVPSYNRRYWNLHYAGGDASLRVLVVHGGARMIAYFVRTLWDASLRVLVVQICQLRMDDSFTGWKCCAYYIHIYLYRSIYLIACM